MAPRSIGVASTGRRVTRRDGMLTLESSMSNLVQRGIVTWEDAVARSLYPKDIETQPRLRAPVSA